MEGGRLIEVLLYLKENIILFIVKSLNVPHLVSSLNKQKLSDTFRKNSPLGWLKGLSGKGNIYRYFEKGCGPKVHATISKGTNFSLLLPIKKYN